MVEQTLKAADNAALANELVAKATTEQQLVDPANVKAPTDLLVELPGGTVLNGEVVKKAVVRELNGRDEESIARAESSAKMFATIINRATVSVGNNIATEEILDGLLVGDRDALLLGIYRATFGPTAELSSYCSGCRDVKTVEINVLEDIKVKPLLDVQDAKFTVSGKNKEFVVTLPTGVTQKKILANPDANLAESMTTLLEQTVLEIDGKPVFSKSQIQALGVLDRRALGDAIAARNPGPQFDDVIVTCPDCDGKVQVPIDLGAMFRF